MFECNRLSNGAAPVEAAVQANFKILVPKYFCSDTIVTLKQDVSPECYLTLKNTQMVGKIQQPKITAHCFIAIRSGVDLDYRYMQK